MISKLVCVVAMVGCSNAKAPDTKPETPTKPTPPTGHTDSGPKCDATRPAGNADPKLTGCHADAECTTGKNGRCNQRGGGHEMPRNDCEYDACFRDDDCGVGATCRCQGTGNFCIPGNCRTDADCGGKACGTSNGCRAMPEGNFCHKADDECGTDDDCYKKTPGSSCQYRSEVGHWACVQMNCPVG